MRFKFFLTIFFALTITALSISAIHFHFFKLERIRLIELNLLQNATLLIDGEIPTSKKELLHKGDAYVDRIIGDDKVNIIVSIYNRDGALLYANENAEVFDTPEEFDLNYQQWEDVERGDYFFKYLTTPDRTGDRIFRVGMVLNQSLLRWKYLSQRVLLFASIVLTVILLISYVLTTLLFRPVLQLADQVNAMTGKIDSGDLNEFKSMFNLTSNRFKDEFSDLLASIHKLATKITENHNITKKWSAMMAHELKTPLTILKNRVETLSLEGSSSAKKIADVDEAMLRMESIIEDFLQWASFENDPSKPEIHAVSLFKRSEFIVQNLKETFPQAQIDLRNFNQSDARVFCNPIHLDQLLSNIITNSIKYGKGVTKVSIHQDSVSVSDDGPGVPLEILEKLGSPFNHISKNGTAGFGLGLAWVSTICRKYGWELLIDPAQRNIVEVHFHSSDE